MSSFGAMPEYIYDGGGLGKGVCHIPLLHLGTINGFFVKNYVRYELNMQQRVKFSSHRHGCPHFSAEETTSSPISLKIYKGSLENREDGQDLLQVLVVGNIDKNETSGVEEHHLQAALATSTVQIPIPGSIQLIENYAELYPSNRWMDTATYLQSAQTISEACSAALLDHDYIYFVDEADKTWLDNKNYQCRVEEQIAQETPSAETGSAEIKCTVSFKLIFGAIGTKKMRLPPAIERRAWIRTAAGRGAAYIPSSNSCFHAHPEKGLRHASSQVNYKRNTSCTSLT
ncbi:hypothetical protein B0H13DRAFT_1888528 [Mycena leptocephala]|nr:hypothetical protein B0H13DRAFT_1888528 [Mycena leptocephala]